MESWKPFLSLTGLGWCHAYTFSHTQRRQRLINGKGSFYLSLFLSVTSGGIAHQQGSGTRRYQWASPQTLHPPTSTSVHSNIQPDPGSVRHIHHHSCVQENKSNLNYHPAALTSVIIRCFEWLVMDYYIIILFHQHIIVWTH